MEKLKKCFASMPAVWLTLLACAVLLVHVSEYFTGGICSNDIHTYWQYARNLLMHRGLVGNTLASYELWSSGFSFLPLKTVLHPVAVATVVKFLGADWILACVFVSSVFYVMTVPLLFAFVRRWLGLRQAVVACVFFIFYRLAVQFTLYGGSDPIFTFFLLASVFVLFASSSFTATVLGSVLFGLCAVSRPVGPMYLPAMLLLVFLMPGSSVKKRCFNAGLVFVAAVFFLKLPQLVNTFVFGLGDLYARKTGGGSAVLLFMHSNIFPGYTVRRALELPDPVRTIVFDPAIRVWFVLKVLGNGWELIKSLPGLLIGGRAFFWLFVIGLLCGTGEDKGKKLKIWLVVCIVMQSAVLCMSLLQPRYLYPFAPFILALAAHGIIKIYDFFEVPVLRKKILLAVAVLFLLLPLPIGGSVINAEYFFYPFRRAREIKHFKSFGRFINSVLPPEAPVLSDGGPWMADVYAGGTRFVGAYPRNLSGLVKLHREKMDINAFYVSSQYIGYDLDEWRMLLDEPKSIWGFEPYVFHYGDLLRAVLYVRDGKKLCNEVLARSKEPGLELWEQIDKVCRALDFAPRDEGALKRFDELRAQADAQSAVLEKALEAVKGLDAEQEFEAGKKLARFKPVFLSDACAVALRSDRDAFALLEAGKDYRLLLSGCIPAPGVLTDTRAAHRENSLLCEDIELVFVFDEARMIDEVCVRTNIDRDYLGLGRIDVYVSADGRNWIDTGKGKDAGLSGINGIIQFRISELGLVCTKLKVHLKKPPFKSLSLGEVEITARKHDS